MAGSCSEFRLRGETVSRVRTPTLKAVMRLFRWTPTLLPLLALAAVPPVTAQAIDQTGGVQAVRSVEFGPPRIDGPPRLILITDRTKLEPMDGTYVSPDRKALEIRDGRIVAVDDPRGAIRQLRVTAIDEVAVRQDRGQPAIWLEDSRGRSMTLPDGQFANEKGQVLVIKGGTVVGYDPGPAFPL